MFIQDPNYNLTIAKSSDHTLRILSYNVHGFRDLNNNPTYTEIIDVITKINPDIIVFEEFYLIGFPNVKKHREICNDLEIIGLCFSFFSDKYNQLTDIHGLNAIFSKYAFKSEIINFGIYPDPYNNPINGIVANININGDQLIVIGCHLDVFDETGTTRINQINTILDKIRLMTNNTECKIIITGDFNSLKKK